MNVHRSLRIASIVLGLMAVAGCGEDPGIDQGPVDFSGTRTEALGSMKNEMQKNMQNRPYAKEGSEAGKPGAASTEAAETKPPTEAASGAETKPAAEAAPGAGTNPAAEAKTAPKGQ